MHYINKRIIKETAGLNADVRWAYAAIMEEIAVTGCAVLPRDVPHVASVSGDADLSVLVGRELLTLGDAGYTSERALAEHQRRGRQAVTNRQNANTRWGSRQKAAPKPKPEPKVTEIPVISMPTNKYDTDSEEVGIPQSKINEWLDAYQAIDVMQELRNARQWLLNNPKNRKTARGMSKFVNGWLQRSQDKAGRQAQNADGFRAGLFQFATEE